jgi:hypothetical protein
MSETPQKRLYIKTYGCQMNVYDSERMADVLRPLGYGVVDEPEGADLVVLNTCHIREKATEKVYSELGFIKQMRSREGRGRRSHDHRRGRLRGPGRGRRSCAASRRWIWWSGPSPITSCPS